MRWIVESLTAVGKGLDECEAVVVDGWRITRLVLIIGRHFDCASAARWIGTECDDEPHGMSSSDGVAGGGGVIGAGE